MKSILTFILCGLFMGILAVESLFAEKNIDVFIPRKSDSVKRFAAKELAKHLSLITGQTVSVNTIDKNASAAPSGNIRFFVGIRPPEDNEILKPEEARFFIQNTGTVYLYGDDEIRNKGKNDMEEIADWRYTKAGTLSAVYNFLENELGVHWIEPGDIGIIYKEAEYLNLKPAAIASWVPKLQQRHIRLGGFLKRNDVPSEFIPTPEEIDAENINNAIWYRRMRLGRSLLLDYKHAFTDWWDKYGESNPGYFGLNEHGKRGPIYSKEKKTLLKTRAKMCVSNADLIKEIVKQWREDSGNINTKNPHIINACENDGTPGFCRCPECMALDTRKEGEDFYSHLTDRYIHFWNSILKEAVKYDKDAKVISYVYTYYSYPPRREKVSPGIILGFVPPLLINLDEYLTEWEKAGAKEIFLRPNHLVISSAIIAGTERLIFNDFMTAFRHGIIATDYDGAFDFWNSSGMPYYILAKAHTDPDKTFEYWENEYCSMFGEAAPYIKEYYRMWRDIFEKRNIPCIMGNYRSEIVQTDDASKYTRLNNIEKCYNEKDFEKAAEILGSALKCDISQKQKKYIEQQILGNEHALLTFYFLKAVNAIDEKNPDYESYCRALNISRKLVDFRKENKDKINISWAVLFGYIECLHWRKLEKTKVSFQNKT